MSEIMLMSERPLALDVSKWQREPFDLYTLLLNWNNTDLHVHLVYIRAGVGTTKDKYFLENFQDAKDAGKYVTSYWAVDPEQDWQTQLDMWFEVYPNLHGIPRVVDAELHGSLTTSEYATFIKWLSDNILAHDGVRPWIYAGFYTLRDYVCYYNTQKFVEDHYYIIAHYGDGDADEDDDLALVIPDKIPVDNVIYRQTTSKAYMPGYDASPIDRNRFLLGGIAEVHEFMSQYFIPETPDNDYSDLAEWLDNLNGVVTKNDHDRRVEDTKIWDFVSRMDEAVDARFTEMMDGIKMVDEAVDSRFNDLENEVAKLKLRVKILEAKSPAKPWWRFW